MIITAWRITQEVHAGSAFTGIGAWLEGGRWNSHPPPESTRHIGTSWAITKKSLVLKVPSSVIPEEHNYLINPMHPGAAQLKIGKTEPFNFDSRIKT